MKTQFELETMAINRENLQEVVAELKELNSHFFFSNVINCYRVGAIDKNELAEQYTQYKKKVVND